jgi:hypothetical protein
MGFLLDRHGEGGGGAQVMTINIDWLGVVLFLIVPILLAIGAVLVVRRSERRLGGLQGNRDWLDSAPNATQADAVTEYLDRMTSTLSLPAADVAEVRAELDDHIGDSIESLQAEGLDREKAIRESLARLGSPDELGRQIRVAHQSTRRLLAGAGGGVFAASGGFVVGWVGGMALAYGLLILGALCFGLLTLAGVGLPDLSSSQTGLINSLMLAGAFMFAATQATRFAVRASAGISRRAPRSIAIFWALTSAAGFGWWAIFGLRGPMSWPGVIAFLCVPVVAYAAAFVRIERPMPHVGRNAIAAGLGGLVIVMLSLGLLLGVTVHTSSGSLAPLNTGPAQEVSRGNLPPDAPEAWNPDRTINGGGVRSDASGGELYSAITDQQLPVSMATALLNWHDLRFEAWHWLEPREPDYAFGVDTRYSSPAIVLPAEIHPTWLQAVFHFERVRDPGPWEVMLTGVGPDGRRYTIADCGGGNSAFNGSVWDWLTAPL